MNEKRYDSPRGEVTYWISRQDNGKLPLVLLHGLTADHTLLDRQVEAFQGERTVLVWDAPGHGQSRPYTGFSYPHLAEDLRGILRKEGISRAVLVGQSMGGYVIQTLLLRWPELAAGFVSVDSCPFGEGYYSRSDLWWLAQVGWMSGLYPHRLLTKAMAAQTARTDYGRENLRKALSVYSKRELCDLLAVGYGSFLKTNQPLEITCPVLLLVGEYDRTGKVLAYNRAWSRRLGLSLHVIPEAAHNSNADNPQAVNGLIQGFLEELERE